MTEAFKWCPSCQKSRPAAGFVMKKAQRSGACPQWRCGICAERKNPKTVSGRIVTYNGDSRSIGSWAQLTGIPRETIVTRLNRGWSVETTLTKGAKNAQQTANQ